MVSFIILLLINCELQAGDKLLLHPIIDGVLILKESDGNIICIL